jgi:hypothetical protein
MRRGIWVLDEDDIAKLIGLPKGQRVIGVHEDWQRLLILVAVEGEGLPEVVPGSDPPIVGHGIPRCRA